jgi:RNA polymerase sigma factor (sigma-70 family)
MPPQRSRDFASCYERNVDRVYAFLAYRVSDRQLVEDLTQVTFERALGAWTRFDPDRGSEITWLLTISRNALIDEYRRQRAQFIDADAVAESDMPVVPGPDDSIDVADNLSDALAALGDREREVIALRFGGDLGGAEIANLLGLQLANVHQILSRSLRKLRASLGPTEGTESRRHRVIAA